MNLFRWFLIIALTLLALPIAKAAAPAKPNIIFILADDLGYGDVGCYGQKNIKTPNIDRLAAQGLRFTQGYAGSTVCAPSRCVLMTGLHTGHCRVRGNGGATPVSQALRTGDTTVASLLQKAGYTTALTGKWGLGDTGLAEVGLPRRQGFDYFYGYASQTHAHNYYPTFLWRNEAKVTLRNVVPNEKTNGTGVATTRLDYSAALIADEALAFVRRAKDLPFFLYYASTLPHANNEAKNKGMETPDFGEYANRDWPEPVKGHAAMVSRLDRDVGRMLDLLKELGLDDKTIVFFASDNGPHKEGGYDPTINHSSGPLRGIKRAMYEGGIRVPFIARWPGVIKPGAVSDESVWFADFLPTAAALAEAKAPAHLDGANLLPHLRNPARHVKRSAPLYWEFFEGGFKQALREGDWKLINNGAGKPLELYSLRQDLGETNNVAAQNAKVVKHLEALLAKARVDTPDWPINPPRRNAKAAADGKTE